MDIVSFPWNTLAIKDPECRRQVTFFLDTLNNATGLLSNCRTAECFQQSQEYLGNAQFALRQIDSFGRIPADILDFTNRWQGSWDECVQIQAPTDPSYRTKFCWIELGPNLEALGQKGYGNLCNASLKISWSVCMPRVCSSEDVAALMSNIQSGLLDVCSADCREAYISTADAKFWIPIGYCTFVVVLMILSTLFDYVTSQKALVERTKRLRSNLGKYIPRTSYFNFQSHIQIQNKTVGITNLLDLGARILLTFSMYTNGAEILDVERRRGQIDSINCIRAFSITWVMVGHALAKFQTGDNMMSVLQSTNPFLNNMFQNAFVSVDSFLFVGGLLLSYLFFRDMERRPRNLKSPVYWILYYVHRIVRLSPCYFLYLGFYVGMYPYLTKGPAVPNNDYEDCKKYWWRNLLYINNLFKSDNSCMGHTWYLALDMQIHIFAPIFLVPMVICWKAGVTVAIALILASIGATYGVYAKYHFAPSIVGQVMTGLGQGSVNDFFHYIYFAPWIRFTPHLLGMLTGYILYKHRNRKINIHPILAIILWLVSIAFGIVAVFGLYDYLRQKTVLNTAQNASYYAFHRIVWSLALAWVVYACEHNFAGPIKNFMELGMWKPLGRLTYSAYLTHYFLIDVVDAQERFPIHYSNYTEGYIHLGLPVFVVSYVFAFFWSCAFEVPFGKLERMAVDAIIGKGKWKPAPKPESPTAEATKAPTDVHVEKPKDDAVKFINKQLVEASLADKRKNPEPVDFSNTQFMGSSSSHKLNDQNSYATIEETEKL
uniref:NRF domain-containing protein n=1 Tax=Syphacia muris TaxID=451379 RepID=A0A0N5AH02_9BILA